MSDDAANSAKEIRDAYIDANKEAKSFASMLQSTVSHLKEGGAAADVMASATQSMQDAMSDNLTASEKLNSLLSAQDQMMQDAAKAGYKVNGAFMMILQTQIDIQKAAEEFEKTQEDIKSLEEERKDKIKELADEYDLLGNKAKEFSDLAKDPKMIGVVAMGMLMKEIGAVGKASRELVKTLGAVGGQAMEITGQVAETTAKFRMMGVDATEAAAAVGSIYMNTALTGEEMDAAIDKVAVLSEGFGMSADQAAEMVEQSAHAGLNADDLAISLARARGVAPAAVLADMAGSTEEISRFGKDGAASFVEASVGAKQLGIEVKSVVDAGRSLLDVESSIEKQMEAEVLLGRTLNLDKARQAALAGDQATVMEEILKNVGSIADFQAMNVIEQEAFASALGMSVPDIINMAANQEKVAGLSQEAKEHYEATGEILAENNSLSEGAVQAMTQLGMAAAQAVIQFGLMKGMQAMFGGNKTGGMTDAISPSSSPAAPKGGVSDMGVSKVGKNMKNIVAGAAAMILVAAAVFIFGKAVQEFMKVSWSAIGMAVVAMLALVGAVSLIGAIMLSGVGAAAIIAGAQAMVIVAVAVLVLAAALYVMSMAIPNFLLLIDVLPKLAIGMMMMYPAIPAMLLMGYALIPLGVGLVFAAVGALAFSAAGGAETITALGLALPALAAVNPLSLAALGFSFIALGFGLGVLAIGLAVLSPFVGALAALGMVMPTLSTELTALAGLGGALFTVALGIGSIALSIVGLAASLLLLTPMLPTLLLLGSVLGGTLGEVLGGGESGGGDKSSSEIVDRLDKLEKAILGMEVTMDGQKVGEIISLSGGAKGIF